MTMIVSTVLGVTAAQAFRKKFRGSGVVFYLIVLGMMVPGVLPAVVFQLDPRRGEGHGQFFADKCRHGAV